MKTGISSNLPDLPIDLSPDARTVALALALFWAERPPEDVYNLLNYLDLKREGGKGFLVSNVANAIKEIREKGGFVKGADWQSGERLINEVRAPLYRYLLETVPGAQLREVVFKVDRLPLGRTFHYWPVYRQANTISLLRVLMFTDTPVEEFRRLFALAGESMNASVLLRETVLDGFDRATFDRVLPERQVELVLNGVVLMLQHWWVAALPLCELATEWLDADPNALPGQLRLMLADFCLQRGDRVRFERALAGMTQPLAQALRAAARALKGEFADAQLAFEAALKQQQADFGLRKNVFPPSVAWFYPLMLLGQGSPRHLELARKFCISESGKRNPGLEDYLGAWTHAIGVKLGMHPVLQDAFLLPPATLARNFNAGDFWSLLLAAWIGPDALGYNARILKVQAESMEALRGRLQSCGLQGLAQQAEAAWAVICGEEPPAGFFVASKSEQWRDVLAALEALAEGGGKSSEGTARIVWSLELGEHGDVLGLAPLEQKRGTRGWGKPREITLSKFAGLGNLSAPDMAMTRCLRADRYSSRRFELDRAAGIVALIGHPYVVLGSNPEQFVELLEGKAEIEAVQEKGAFRLRVTPAPHPEKKGVYHVSSEQRQEAEALRFISVLSETPQRYRVVRLTDAQRRAAQLVSGRFAVPASAQKELQNTLHSLAQHFQVHSDSTEAAREVEPESRLRAELAPSGEGLMLHLVVAPLGVEGPRLPPATGRARVMAAIKGESVGARRDLNAERAHLDALLDALPFLEDPDVQGGCEWRIDSPEDALAMVETLPRLPGVDAVEWPKGKSVRVITLEPEKLAVSVQSERDWFRLSGQAQLDDGLVLAFEDLLEAARGKSRFIPMGDGAYAALTRSLKERLAELAAVAESHKGEARIPRLAAAWLDDALDGLEVDVDVEFRAAIDRLRAAQATAPKLPKSLQAELRPYQEDGFQWAMRLASAGLGACLADDMGLGKTLQALAVLLARGNKGPALVVAPTSVCGNWLAEAQRFAPSLNARIYGENGREELLAKPRKMDLVIVSYTLLQQAGELFAAQKWHTLITDEAQAIKNATAKRTQAVYELQADFRMALSGTPVENRLAELWSIMRFANPGLLGTLPRFNERFSGPIERNRDRNAQHLLRRLIAPFILRRTKGEVLDELPPRTELVLDIAPEAAEAAHYEALRRQAIDEVERSLASGNPAAAKFNILAQLTRLRRTACDPRLGTPELPFEGAKVQAFTALAAELSANGHKTLVFSQFVDFLQILRKPLDDAGITYQYLDGSTPAAERTKRVAAFQAGEGDLFLISLKAGGFGLNLTAADYVVITDPWWNPAAEDQAMGRAHRMGQKRPVTVYRLVTKGTIEERIIDLHHDKRALAEGVLSGEESASLPSTDDLIALMRGD